MHISSGWYLMYLPLGTSSTLLRTRPTMVRNTSSYHSQVRDAQMRNLLVHASFDYKRIAFVFPIGRRDFRCRNGLRR